MTIPHRMVTIDPGDRHVGWVEWVDGRPVNAIEYEPDKAMDRLEAVVDRLDLLVYERYLLYGWLAAQQVGSEFATSQLIGAIKHVCRRQHVPVVGHTAAQMKALYKIKPWVNLKPRQWPTYGKGPHVRDAFMHGVLLLRTRGIDAGKLILP
jgi:hypothetical protein